MEKQTPFHQQLRHEREVRGWSQADLAEKVGSGVKTVGRWESGKSLPSPYFRQMLSVLFGKNVEELGLLGEQARGTPTMTSSPGTTGEPSPSPLQPPAAGEIMVSSEDNTMLPRQPVSVITTENEPFHSGLGRNTPEPDAPKQGALLCSYDIHPSWVIAVAWEPHGNRIASAGGDGTVHVWHDTGQHLLTYRGHARTGFLSKTNFLPIVYAVAWSPTEPRIASSGNGKTVHIWNADTGGTNFVYKGHSGLLPDVYALAWSPDGSRMASACSSTGIDKTIHVWDTKTGQIILRYDTHPGLTPNFSVLAAAWSPDGTRIASTCGNRTIRVWNAATGEHISTCSTTAPWVSSIAWSPDGTRLATANSDHTVQIWDTETERIIRTYSGHSESVRDVAWSPDGVWIASASNDKTVQIWDPATGSHFFTYRGHTHWTTSVAWSPDGTRIASASNDKTVQIWQAR